jgi:D-alanine-D-alanine ligase
MSLIKKRNDLPVLVLHNVDSTWLPADIEEAFRVVSELESALRRHGHPVKDVPVYNADLSERLRDYDPDHYIVLNWCEEFPGISHSEALVAQALSELNFTYTGSPPAVLAFSWDKGKVKHLLDRCAIPNPCWRFFDSPQPDGWNIFPAIVKPGKEHCSLGITSESVVLTPGGLRERIGKIVETFHQPALVEDFIDGREFHVFLWGNSEIRMLPPTEMDFFAFENISDRLCTFDSKFRPGSKHYEEIQLRVPAQMKEAEYQLLEQTAFSVYHAFGCRDYARLDIRLRDGIFYVIDVNPNPDIGPETSMAYAAEIAGHSYGEMISYLINLAAQRHPIFGSETK